jgi:hypothetical protein
MLHSDMALKAKRAEPRRLDEGLRERPPHRILWEKHLALREIPGPQCQGTARSAIA